MGPRPLIGRRSRLTFALSCLLGAGSAEAQLVTLELSYSNPGARSVGFGGAFVALADDATSAFANPSGLVQLVRPEVSVEGRRWSYDTPYTAGGRLEGTPSGLGLDTAVGLRTGHSEVSLNRLSFLSAVYPKGDWSFAAYRHQLVAYRFSGALNALFADAPAPEGADPGFAGVVRDQDSPAALELDVVSYGLAVAFRPTESLSLGVSLSLSDGRMRVASEEYLPDDDSIDSYFGAGSFLPSRLEKITTVDLDDTAWTLGAGFLWRIASGWRFGGFYRQGPEFTMELGTKAGPAGPYMASGSVSSPVALPDVYGLGIAYRTAGGHLTLAVEWDRVEYSDILDSLDPALKQPPTAGIDDGSELHFGAEYAFLASRPVVALRFGAWLDPDHRARARDDEPFSRAIFRGGDDKLHYAVGFGLAFEKLQLDLAVDLSALRDTVSASAIFSF